MDIIRLDHLVLTVVDIERTCTFYCNVLGMQRVTFGNNRTGLLFGQQKINLHLPGWDDYLRADKPTPGSADLCFLVDRDVALVAAELGANAVELIDGPVEKIGASGPIRSIYFRDPDGNLIEVSNALNTVD
jgi:catechol 2,3-dioxygenase-like lactoylglutathione lyase family enzyme